MQKALRACKPVCYVSLQCVLECEAQGGPPRGKTTDFWPALALSLSLSFSLFLETSRALQCALCLEREREREREYRRVVLVSCSFALL